ncbi:MAG: endonuclease/exonuclease/phosphatase family protein [Candidatus Babeliales bacterium]
MIHYKKTILASVLTIGVITTLFLNANKVATPKQHQTMPIHQLWHKIAHQEKPTAINRQEKLDLFEKTIQAALNENNKIPKKKNDIFRILSYNVHFLKDSNNKPSEHTILHSIEKINPDVAVLQELYVEDSNAFEHNTTALQKKLKKLGYQTILGCKTYKNQAFKAGDWFGNVIISKIKPQKSKSVSFESQLKERGEERCYIYTQLMIPQLEQPLEIIGTHLEVSDPTEEYRLAQIKEILAFPFCTKNVLIAADFNAVRKQDYDYTINKQSGWDLVIQENKAALNRTTPTLVLDELHNKKYTDSFSQLGWHGPHFTTWSGTSIDFIMLAPTWHLPLAGSYVYYSNASDHLPIIMDIKLK